MSGVSFLAIVFFSLSIQNSYKIINFIFFNSTKMINYDLNKLFLVGERSKLKLHFMVCETNEKKVTTDAQWCTS